MQQNNEKSTIEVKLKTKEELELQVKRADDFIQKMKEALDKNKKNNDIR